MTDTVLVDDYVLIKGYSLRDIDKLTARASGRLSHIGNAIDRRDAAWHAIVLALYNADDDETPSSFDLLKIGMGAIYDEGKADSRHHGRDTHKNAPGPRYSTYWSGRTTQGLDFTDALTDRIALPQTLEKLEEREYRVLVARAAFDTDGEAAAAMGMPIGTFRGVLTQARLHFTAAWFDHETPHVRRANAIYCASGHPRAEYEFIEARGRRKCRECARITSRASAARIRQRKREEQMAAEPAA